MLPLKKEKVWKVDVCNESAWLESVFRNFLNKRMDEMMLIRMAR